MSSFFRFIAKHTAYLYFLLYCSISIMFMQLQRKETLDAIRERGLSINAAISREFTGATAIFTLERDNQQLFLQNARLFAQLLRQQAALRDASELNAIQANAPQWTSSYKVARVVDRRFSATDNMLIIDAGSRQGIARDMAVLTPDGLVGRVIDVSPNYAKVLPVINQNFMVSVVSDSTLTSGLLAWRNGNERLARMEHVPVSSRLLKGERLTTSGYSTFATRGIPVGQVIRISKGKLFYNIDVRLSVDFSSLSWVLVSTAKPSMEKIELMESPDVPEKGESTEHR
ncbi:rod shape-determining protein MreC [Chlorobaculum limnaeum]|uniref:Cell shape-determining protein MreC n=1 Tax=Chlorobaculum limnaeum TaxID=274537 RepID=A0A1D8D4H2_CHLLM|nr:rod shape-determining protein MreC [Chlorobaculum limnaeum]AOS84107.1 rod shape-determining protein MreC [Chlorobaculum limnaeum]